MSQLEVRDLTVTIGASTILDGVSLTVPPATVVGLLGANGAGKSTTIDAVAGYQPTRSGSVRLNGREISRLSASRRARLGITRTFQDYLLFEDLTVEENLLSAAEIGLRKNLLRDLARFGRPVDSAQHRVENILDGHNLTRYRRTPVEQLSLGWHARVNLARAAAQDPQVLLLDEPAAALSLDARRAVTDTIATLRDHDGLGILLIEHNLDVVRAVCDEVYLLDEGRLIAHGPTADILELPQVRAVYFGEQPDDTEFAAPVGAA
ncbi:ATP-binding cassette domain-containing protein [Nocardia sp. NPDC052254]|uniref:ABC transporter ATP-binding protein n=1 Tax=Nocardia sp. NPDC052254 TaxID=3155681 RepID=UPI0034403A61